MKRIIILSLLIVIVLSISTACSKESDEIETTETTETTETVTETVTDVLSELDETEAIGIANAFFDDYIAGDYAAAYAHPFDNTMKVGFPETMMKSVSEQIVSSYGAFIEKKGEKTGYTQGYFIVTIGGVHEKKALAYNVVFNTDLEISGFNYNEINDIDTFFEGTTGKENENENDLRFGSEDFPLVGTLLYPEGEGNFPVVILVHGSGPNDRDVTLYGNKPFKDIAEGLTEQGIAVFRYDKRTYTHSGKYADPDVAGNVTIYNEVIDDARYAVDFIKTQENIDPSKIFVLGHSLGGNQAPRIAEGRDDIAGLIIMGGNVTPIQDLMLYQYEYLYSLEDNLDEATEKLYKEQIEIVTDAVALINSSELGETTDPNLTLGIPAKYWLDLKDYDPTKIAIELDIPILILQGERDYQVPMAEFEKWKESLLGKAEYRLYDSLNHLFMAGEGTPGPAEYMNQSKVSKDVIDDIADWIGSM